MTGPADPADGRLGGSAEQGQDDPTGPPGKPDELQGGACELRNFVQFKDRLCRAVAAAQEKKIVQ